MGHAVVVGASLAGVRTAQALRRRGWNGPITLVGAEPHAPYDRPPLSKGFLLGGVDRERLGLATGLIDVELLLGRSATRLDLAGQSVDLDDGTGLAYDALVIATGAAARTLPGPPRGGVHTLRTLDDAVALRAALRPGARVVVVGGGFVGAEVAASCRELGLEVAIVEPEPALMARGLGPVLGAAAARRHAAHGVRPYLGRTVTRLHGEPDVTAVELDDGTELPADVVVVGIGSRPATGWLDGSGLTLADGVVCDETLAAAPGVYAVGDVARRPSRRYGTSLRTEHWTAAGEQAAAVAATLCGTPTPHDPVPYVWSDQFGVKLQILGVLDRSDELTVLDGDPAGERFVAVAGDPGRPRAAVTLGAPGEAAKLRRSLDR